MLYTVKPHYLELDGLIIKLNFEISSIRDMKGKLLKV